MSDFKLCVTDKNDKLVFVPEINNKKEQIINHMVSNKKTMMIYHGLFVNLTKAEDAISSDKSSMLSE